MNSGANIAVDPSSAFISAASQKDPLTYHQGVRIKAVIIHIINFTLKLKGTPTPMTTAFYLHLNHPSL